jgi:hypothetical protein
LVDGIEGPRQLLIGRRQPHGQPRPVDDLTEKGRSNRRFVGLGAYVRWAALGVSGQTRAFVSLAGPAIFSQPAFLLVAGGAGYRAFSKDIPPAPSYPATAYYLMVLAALGYLTTLAPVVLPAAK